MSQGESLKVARPKRERPGLAPEARIAFGSVAELCEATGLSKTSIYAEIKKGTLVGRKYGRRTVFLRSDVEGFMRSLPTTVERAFMRFKGKSKPRAG